jgi:hypothetical protein
MDCNRSDRGRQFPLGCRKMPKADAVQFGHFQFIPFCVGDVPDNSSGKNASDIGRERDARFISK